MSCRCPGGLLETPPRWHVTIYMDGLKLYVEIFGAILAMISGSVVPLVQLIQFKWLNVRELYKKHCLQMSFE